MARQKRNAGAETAQSYQHPESDSPMRPDVGTQAQFRKKRPPKTYKYDSSLSPALDWDGQNPAREQGEALIGQILDAKSLEEAKAAAERLKALSKPFLDWAGKAERLSFDVPTLPLFIHERLSTKAIIETLEAHKRDRQTTMFDLFGDPLHSVTDQVLRAYEHRDEWVNRMILGDSLVVMNSLLNYEGLGGQVQTIYMDPPYGVKFGSNFQPFIRKRDVTHGDDDDMTREPEMVQAYRDTWELGLHSYLTYMRDRLLLCRDLVQTTPKVIERCLLMTTDPGDLVLDPTCGSGTTAYVAEQWGRRWITVDTSRVPLALARQRVLTATFSYYELKDEARGPAGGFVYRRKQNSKGEEVGGIVPHVTLKSIANNEPPAEEVLVDRPETISGVTRVTGRFSFEATIPTPVDWEGDGIEDSGTVAPEQQGAFVDRMLEVLRKSPVLHLGGGKTVVLKRLRLPTKTLSLSAEAFVDATAPGQEPSLEEAVQESVEKSGIELPLSAKPVALIFGPENGAVSEKLVYEAAREAHAKNYSYLYVIGFAIQANARMLIDHCAEVVSIPATYVQATPDLMMGDLLKNMRSSQIFSVCGLPEIKLTKVKAQSKDAAQQYQVELVGLDVFDPITMEVQHQRGDDVPAWFLDTDYNDMCFHVCQAFFPRTSAWENLKRALRGSYEETVWDHLAGTISAPFECGEHKQAAVKVIDVRGNELLVVKSL